jgi:hypothetical protein
MTDLANLYHEILEAKKSDAELSVLCDRAAAYARLHLYARKITGCNGLGEIENLLDEFRQMIYEIIKYCGKKNYIDDLAIFTIDVTDKELEKLGAELGEFL